MNPSYREGKKCDILTTVINLGMELVNDRWYNTKERFDELERNPRKTGYA